MDSGTAARLLQERETRINEAVALREPDRVPIMCIFGFFPARMTGISFQESMFDYDKAVQAWVKERPLSILHGGTADDVKDYCKQLIDKVGKGGGFIMDAASNLDDAKPENLKAMFDFTKDYDRYR